MLFGSEQNPKGPGWRRLRTVEKELSGTRVRFNAPPMRLPLVGRSGLEEQPDHLDLSSSDIYTPYGNPDPDQGIFNARLWLSGWNFTGRPILDGNSIGDLVLRLSVHDVRDMPVNHSLFQRSEVVELAERLHRVTEIGEYHDGHPEDPDPNDLTTALGLSCGRWPNYLSPINSQWLERNGSEWLYLEVQPLWDGSDDFYWFSPIGHRHCLVAHFMVERCLHNAGNPYRRATRSPIANYRQLMENIMDSMVVELSDEAEAERQTIHNADNDYPLPHCTEQLVKEAKHTLYMWSDMEYREKEKGPNDDHRAPKKEVAAFIDERIKPRPLTGNLAIGPAFVEGDEIGTSRAGLIRAEGN